MQTISINKKNALTAYKNADKPGKKLLSDLLGTEVLSEKTTDRIKTFEDACEELAVEPAKVIPFSSPADDHQEALNAVAKIFIIAKALNGDWKADFSNKDQYKYYPWFRFIPGSGLSYRGCDCWATHSPCGVRLCYKDAETAEYTGKQFLDIYKKFL